VARGDPPADLEGLIRYWRGVYYATVALKTRLVKLGREQRPAVEQVNTFQAMAQQYLEALTQTAKLHRERS
jgi:hypothetical protein